MTADDIIERLNLTPHPAEGGYFRETYRSSEHMCGKEPSRYGGSRCFCTAIYYLLTPDTCSAMHKVQSDEIFHFYLGDPVLMLHLDSDGASRTLILGADMEAGHRPQVVVARGTWQGSLLMDGGEWALMGTTVAPGFEYADYVPGERTALVEAYPDREDLILRLTPQAS